MIIQVTERYAHLAPDKLVHAVNILDNYHSSIWRGFDVDIIR